jgi:hypothetical protein
MIQRTCDNWLKGKLLGDGELLSGRGAIHEMAKEPRFMRRVIAERIVNAINAFPSSKDGPKRYLSFFNSFYPKKGYVFLQIWIPTSMRGDEDTYRAKRQSILQIACGAAKNYYPHLQTVIGIATPPPKLENKIGEDFLWLDCTEWSEETRAEYEELNESWNFFATGTPIEEKFYEFVHSPARAAQEEMVNVGRNEPCPCGSGKKFKKCHGNSRR